MCNDTFGRNKMIKMLAYIVLGTYTILVAYPLLFMLFTSFKTNKEFFTNLFFLPEHYEFMNYVKAWNIGKIGLYFTNSVIVTGASVLITSVVSLLGGYALAKLYIPKANLIAASRQMHIHIRTYQWSGERIGDK